MVRKISLIGLFISALLISGCAKEEPETTSTPSATSGMENDIAIDNPVADVDVSDNVSSDKQVVKIQTSMGDILVELNEEKAPITVKNFLNYVNSGFYNGTIFHRVIKDFMVQGGGFTADMSQKRTNAPIKIESANGLKNDRGTIAMARTNVPDSATSQFFINHVDNGFLNYAGPSNPGYAVFGKVIEGMDVVDKIAVVPVRTIGSMENVPVDVVTIISVSVVSQ